MPHPRFSGAEIIQRGQALYDERIRRKVEASHQGGFLAVDIETGEYEIDVDALAALKRVRRNTLTLRFTCCGLAPRRPTG